MDRDLVKRWAAGHAAAARRALEVMRQEGPPEPAVAFADAMELCALVEVAPADPVRLREEDEARRAWAKVRAWAARRDASR
jgi:hypothetical protein